MRRPALLCCFALLATLAIGYHADAALLNPSFESPDASGGDVAGTADWGTFNGVFTVNDEWPRWLRASAYRGPVSKDLRARSRSGQGGAGATQKAAGFGRRDLGRRDLRSELRAPIRSWALTSASTRSSSWTPA